MLKITIFKGKDSEQDIFTELKAAGIIGISGGRLEAREKLERVRSLISIAELEGYWAQSTLNHPETELGYGYDEGRYNIQEAQKFVMKSFDEHNA